MENSKKMRTVTRSSFTRLFNQTELELAKDHSDQLTVRANLERLRSLSSKLAELDEQILENMLTEGNSVEELEEEAQKSEEYDLNFKKLCFRLENKGEDTEISNLSMASVGKNKLRLPKMELHQFSGEVKDWVYFWASFKKVHEDKDLSEEDKLHYLNQSMVFGTRAHQLVQSFPPTAGNYSQAIEALTNRFGRDELIIEVHTRELLALVISRAVGNFNFSLTELYDKIETQLRTLKTKGVTTDKCAAILFPMVESCLQEDLLRIWQRNKQFSAESTFENRLDSIMAFLRQEVENEERVNLASANFGLNNPPAHSVRLKHKLTTAAALTTGAEKAVCVFCGKDNHESNSCFKAKKMSLEEKRDILKEKKACYRCLKGFKFKHKCVPKCSLCQGKHCEMMCNLEKDFAKDSPKSIGEKPHQVAEHVLTSQTCSNEVLLQTLIVKLKGPSKSRYVRVLIDTGSQKSYICKQTAIELNLTGVRGEQICHTLFGGQRTEIKNHMIYRISLESVNKDYACSIEAVDEETICGGIPQIPNNSCLSEIKKIIPLTDIKTQNIEKGTIEILIGADVAGKLLTGRHRLFNCGLVGVETHLGWTLMGKVPADTSMKTVNALFARAQIEDLWKLDILGIEDPIEKKTRAEQEKLAVIELEKTIVRSNDGRYQVCLPWLDNRSLLPSNRSLAEKRLESTRQNLMKNELIEKYQEVINSWMLEGIISKISTSDACGHFLPHRAVVKSEGTTKIRPVFDASAKQRGNPSLNDCLEKGPNLIKQIPTLVNKFRMWRVGVIADIKQAFLQIEVAPKDREFLKFLWKNKNGELEAYQHNRVVFGVTCSPFLLGGVLEHHLTKAMNQETNKECSKLLEKLKDSFYVDNVVTGVDNLNDLKTFKEVAVQTLKEACFDLRGWEYSFENNPESFAKVLGLQWDKTADTLLINLPQQSSAPITKREILSVAQSIYDPLGFICPALLLPKILLQGLWKSNLDWDTIVPEEVGQQFKLWREEIPLLKDIAIPRWLNIDKKSVCSLHMFCDACKAAYAAVVFLRVETENGVKLQLVQGKTRVAPSKELTIPRLELLAATIGARLMKNVFESLSHDDIPVYLWSDSSTVLTWISRNDHWTVFVYNRVQEIRRLTSVKDWYHVPGSINPADLPSRGCRFGQLTSCRWWEGPDWLKQPVEFWPNYPYNLDETEISREKRKRVLTTISLTIDSFLCRYSSFSKTVRVMAWINRFKENCFTKVKKYGSLEVTEIIQAERKIIKLIQDQSFVEGDKRLQNLHCHKDEFGCLRIESRIVRRTDDEPFLRPVILPADHPLVKQLIMEEHRRLCHLGVQGLLFQLRQQYWVLGGRKTIRSALAQCLSCKKEKLKRMETTTAPLPLDRVRDAAVFEVVGIDFAGPLYLKDGTKSWIMLCTCAVFRAIHLELVPSLSTEEFLQAFRRFVARRGRPSIVFSDNGTNFVGAVNALKQVDWQRIEEYATVTKICWKFNPPRSPWWGGWWERLVRMVKELLRRTLGNSCLSFVELYTILCECEAVINSRPITYVSDDSNDLVPLTPSMFLQDIKEIGVPDLEVLAQQNIASRIRYLSKLRNEIQQRFRKEYLGFLVERKKQTKIGTIEIGDVVLVEVDNEKKRDWPLGLVVELLPSPEGVVRLVRVKCGKGEFLRPIQRLYPLEVRAKDFDNSDSFNKKLDVKRVVTRENVPRETIAEQFKTRSGRLIKRPSRLD